MPHDAPAPLLAGTPELLARIREAAELTASRTRLGADRLEADLRAAASSTPDIAASLVAQVFGLPGPTVGPAGHANRDTDDFATTLRRLLDERDRLGAELRRAHELDRSGFSLAEQMALRDMTRAGAPASALRGSEADRFDAIDRMLARIRRLCSPDELEVLLVGHESERALDRRLALLAHENLRVSLVQLRADLKRGEKRAFLVGWPRDLGAESAKQAVLACARVAARRSPSTTTLAEGIVRTSKRLAEVIDTPTFHRELLRAKGTLDRVATHVLDAAGFVPADTFAKWKRAERRTDSTRAARAKKPRLR